MSYCGNCYAGAPQCGGGGNHNSYAAGSALESAVAEYLPAARMSEETAACQSAEPALAQKYASKEELSYAGGLYLNSSPANYYFTPDLFLNNVPTEFISCGDERQKNLVKSLVENAFAAATGKEVPMDIAIRICSEKELKKTHESMNGIWNSGIKGFSINRKGFGVNEIFVKEDELAKLMLTIGHEIGHVLTFSMKNAVDEEAKAFAFSIAWMDAIRKNNIGGLYNAINPMPAVNGLHNVAFDFVAAQMKKGKNAHDVYSDLIKGEISINNIIPVY